jgi:large subunit ribosomal protein L29
MKVKEIRALDANELRKQLGDADEQMFHLKLKMKMGQLEGLKKYRTLRKDKARINTVLRERELAGGK